MNKVYRYFSGKKMIHVTHDPCTFSFSEKNRPDVTKITIEEVETEARAIYTALYEDSIHDPLIPYDPGESKIYYFPSDTETPENKAKFLKLYILALSHSLAQLESKNGKD